MPPFTPVNPNTDFLQWLWWVQPSIDFENMVLEPINFIKILETFSLKSSDILFLQSFITHLLKILLKQLPNYHKRSPNGFVYIHQQIDHYLFWSAFLKKMFFASWETTSLTIVPSLGCNNYHSIKLGLLSQKKSHKYISAGPSS